MTRLKNTGDSGIKPDLSDRDGMLHCYRTYTARYCMNNIPAIRDATTPTPNNAIIRY